MLTKEDKSWMVDNFVTRGEFHNEVGGLQEGFSRVEKLVEKTLGIVEGIAGRVDDLEQENKFGAETLRRHGVNIDELAKATGAAISR